MSVMLDQIYKYPRLYCDVPLSSDANIALSQENVHYLKNVLRKSEGDVFRVFNGRDGEWFVKIVSMGKKEGSALLTEQIKAQPMPSPEVHLFFTPIKKHRMDILIEKCVELGVNGLHPVITNRTENRNFKPERVYAQIIEAAEQSERLDLPVLSTVKKFSDLLIKEEFRTLGVPFFACVERDAETTPISRYNFEQGGAFLIGPEGGFDDFEIEMISALENIERINLGDRLLRCETAAIVCLSRANIL